MHTSPAGQWVSARHWTHCPVPVLHRGVAGVVAQSLSARHRPGPQTRVTGSQRRPAGHESGATLHPTHTRSVVSHTGVAGVGAHSRSVLQPVGTSTAASGSGAYSSARPQPRSEKSATHRKDASHRLMPESVPGVATRRHLGTAP
jgi:hypothetical protein